MILTDHYCRARCGAITRAGKRCTGAWSSAVPIFWSHNPDTGATLSGPHLVLCHRHRHLLAGVRKLQRFRVVGGWLGAANGYGYGTAVWSGRRGLNPAWSWWLHRRTLKFGESRTEAA